MRGQKAGDFIGAFRSVGEKMVLAFWKTKPQLVISVQPLGNGYIEAETKLCNIPFWILSTDYYAQHFLTGISSPGPLFKMSMMLPDDEKEKKRLKKRGVTDEQLMAVGALLPPPFQGDQAEINAAMTEIEQVGGKVITICMGGAGSPRILTLCQQIAGINFGEEVHVFALCARMHGELAPKIDKIESTTTFHAIGFVDGPDGPAIMGAHIKRADVYISKPGGGSTSEGIAVGTKLFFVKGTSFWEDYNAEGSVQRDWGRMIDDKKFEEDLKEMLGQEKAWPPENFPGLYCDENLLGEAQAILLTPPPPGPGVHEEDR